MAHMIDPSFGFILLYFIWVTEVAHGERIDMENAQ